jgi:hypothetical protein
VGVTEVRGSDGRSWTIRRRIAWPRWRLADGWGPAPPFELDPTGLAVLVLFPLLLAAFLMLLFSVIAVVVEVVVVAVAAYVWRGRWIVEVTTDGPPPERKTWTVRGWRESRRVAAEVAQQL